MLNHTWEEHPDYEDLKKAYEKITQVVETVNKQRGDSERKNRVLNILRQIEGLNKVVKFLFFFF